ncbi:MAG TPA: hypothetical protein VG168_07580, partial [Bryobacteraceae bacterium]|nr:hypothetical protein [Bryobacteraceae bacterium]
PRERAAAPQPEREVFWQGTQTGFGEGVQTCQGAQQELEHRAPGAGIARSECPTELGTEGKTWTRSVDPYRWTL